jgi:hypothetical protein
LQVIIHDVHKSSKNYLLRSLKFKITTNFMVVSSIWIIFLWKFRTISSIHIIFFILSPLLSPPPSFLHQTCLNVAENIRTDVCCLPQFIVLVSSAGNKAMCWIQNFAFGFKKTRARVCVCVREREREREVERMGGADIVSKLPCLQ